MRLINCQTLQLEEFIGSLIPEYAILSHTWGNEEISFAEFNSGPSTSKEGYKKIQFACSKALESRLQYAWVDTCCIDKSSSAELSEAINSMFQWYKNSRICLVYLSDVTLETFEESFEDSRWFRRGWTLQELIAPDQVVFFDKDCEFLGTKPEYAREISEITGINEEVLEMAYDSSSNPKSYSVAQRMSWASDRETTRVEDIAYSLLGIFNVNMPLLYGEGAMAFIRLQEEIIKRTDDESIFAWGQDPKVEEPHNILNSGTDFLVASSILAESPKDFRGCQRLRHGMKPPSPFTMTNLGLQIELPLVTVFARHEGPIKILGWIGLLNCQYGTSSELVGIVLSRPKDLLDGQFQKMHYSIWEGGNDFKSTMLVSERFAIRAIPTKITIIGEDGNRARKSFNKVRKFVVTESLALQDLGYSISTVCRPEFFWTPGDPREERVQWNAETKILTAHDKIDGDEVYAFGFKSSKGGISEFAAIIINNFAIVRSVSSFSEVHNQEFYYSMQNKDILLRPSDGMAFRIAVTMKTKIVCHWQVYELVVDAVHLS